MESYRQSDIERLQTQLPDPVPDVINKGSTTIDKIVEILRGVQTGLESVQQPTEAVSTTQTTPTQAGWMGKNASVWIVAGSVVLIGSSVLFHRKKS